MKRRYGALVFGLALAASCVDPMPTGQVEQGLTDCTAGGNYKGAKMIAQPWWNGAQPPAPSSTSGYVIFQDQQGVWNALLADPQSGKINYAVKLSGNQVGTFLSLLGGYGRIDVGHVPPPPPPNGGDWMARYALEFELRAEALHGWAMAASY